MGSTDGPPVDTSPGVPGCPGEVGLVKMGGKFDVLFCGGKELGII